MKTPVLIINFKNYSEASGLGAVRLAEIASQVAQKLGVEIAVCPPTPFISEVCKTVPIPVFAQHADSEKTGGTTGAIVPESLKAAGAQGSLINHSEKRVEESKISQTVQRLRDIGLTSIVCARTPKEVATYSHYSPDIVAIEPPELIG
jgi:triosephosphate isomerase